MRRPRRRLEDQSFRSNINDGDPELLHPRARTSPSPSTTSSSLPRGLPLAPVSRGESTATAYLRYVIFPAARGRTFHMAMAHLASLFSPSRLSPSLSLLAVSPFPLFLLPAFLRTAFRAMLYSLLASRCPLPTYDARSMDKTGERKTTGRPTAPLNDFAPGRSADYALAAVAFSSAILHCLRAHTHARLTLFRAPTFHTSRRTELIAHTRSRPRDGRGRTFSSL